MDNIIKEACLGIKIILQDENQLELLFERGAHEKVVELLENLDSSYLQEVINILAKISEGEDQYTEALIEIGVFPKLKKVIEKNREKCEIVKEILFVISNLLVQKENHIQVFMEQSLTSNVFELLDSKSKDVQYEALYCIFNILQYGNCTQLQYLFKQNLIYRIIQFKSEKEFKIISLVLDLICVVLEKGLQYQAQIGSVDIFLQFDNYGGINLLNDIESHPNQNISAKAVTIIQKFFSSENCSTEVENYSQPLKLEIPSSGFIFQ